LFAFACGWLLTGMCTNFPPTSVAGRRAAPVPRADKSFARTGELALLA